MVDPYCMTPAVAPDWPYARPFSALFPGLYRQVEDTVMRRGAEFEDSIRGRHDHIAKRQRRLLAGMTLRATSNPPAAA